MNICAPINKLETALETGAFERGCLKERKWGPRKAHGGADVPSPWDRRVWASPEQNLSGMGIGSEFSRDNLMESTCMMAERPAPDRRHLAWPQGAHPHPHPKPQGKPNPGRSGFGPWAAACSLGLSHPHRRRWPSHYCDCPLLPQRTSRVAEELGGGGLWEPGL